jgi:CAAX prenyl protease N-terminal, five membrane helices
MQSKTPALPIPYHHHVSETTAIIKVVPLTLVHLDLVAPGISTENGFPPGTYLRKYPIILDVWVAANNGISRTQRLARFLDRPLFPWKRLIIAFSVGHYLFETFLSFRQYRVLQYTKPPKVLAEEITQETFDKSQAYGRAKAKFSMVNDLYGQIQNIAFIHFDVLPKLWDWTGGRDLPFHRLRPRLPVHAANPLAPRLDIPHLRPGGKVRLQQADA